MTNTPDPVTIETGDPRLFFGYEILVDQSATTTFDSDTGVHNYTVELEEGLLYEVVIDVVGDTLDPVLELERFDGTALGGTSTRDGETLTYSFIADQTDVWNLRISDDGLDDFYTQTYTLQVINTDWITDDSDTLAAFNGGNLIVSGAVFVSSTDFLGDEDWIAMNLQGGVKYGFFLAGNEADYDPRLSIYDTDGETLLKAEREFNKMVSYNYTPEQDGTYFFEARDNLGNDDGGYIAGVFSHGADTLEGTDEADIIVSGGGSDWVVTFNGADTVFGGNGGDTVSGGGGSDSLDGGNGDDSLNGGGQTDTINGADGNDTLNGGGGSDSMTGGDGNDSMQGGNATDTINGSGGNDTLNGGAGGDLISGGGAADELHGDAGRDSLAGGNGSDTLSGNNGADTLDGGNGNDFLTGNGGRDVFLFLDGWGDDTILDFDDRDSILFAGINGVDSVDDLTITEDGDDVIISFGGDTVTIENVVGVLDIVGDEYIDVI